MRPDRPARAQAILDIPFGDGAVSVDLWAFRSPAVDALALETDYIAWAKAVTVEHLTLSRSDAMILCGMVRHRANVRPRTPAAPKRRRRRR